MEIHFQLFFITETCTFKRLRCVKFRRTHDGRGTAPSICQLKTNRRGGDVDPFGWGVLSTHTKGRDMIADAITPTNDLFKQSANRVILEFCFRK
jgi:hypothetical protein